MTSLNLQNLKPVLFILFSTLFIATSAALDFDEIEIEYDDGETHEFIVECGDDLGSCPPADGLEVCNDEVVGVWENADGDHHESIDSTYYLRSSIEAPLGHSEYEARCPIGSYEPTLISNVGDEIESGGQIDIIPENYVFDVLHVDIDLGEFELNEFQEYQGSGVPSGRILIENSGDSENAGYNEMDTGVILTSITQIGKVDTINEALKYPYDEEDDCVDNRCEVATTEFQSMQSACSGDCTFGHYVEGGNADYELYSKEIMAGETYTSQFNPPDSIDNKQLAICVQSLEESEQNFVYSPGTAGEYFYCDSSTGTWNQYDAGAECQDPAIGQVREAIGTTPDGEYYYSTSSEVGLLWDYEDGGEYMDGAETSCTYENADTEAPGDWNDPQYGDTTVYTCLEGGNLEEDSPPIAFFSDYEKYQYDKYQEANTQCSIAANNDEIEEYNGIMPIAVYRTPKDLIPLSNVEDSSAVAYQYSSSFGQYNGFTNHGVQTLHDAEEKYGINPSTTTLEEKHQNLQSRNVIDLQGYRDGDRDLKENAWLTANTGGIEETGITQPLDINETETNVDDFDVFSGGFAGKCPDGYAWSYEFTSGDYECSDSIDWDHQVVVPEFDFQAEYEEKDEFVVGFHFLPENFQSIEDHGMDSYESFIDAASRPPFDYTDPQIDTIYAKCWYGGMERLDEGAFEDSFTEGEDWFGTKVEFDPEPENPIPVYGTLDADMWEDNFFGQEEISCRYVVADSEDASWNGLGNLALTGTTETDNIQDIKIERGYQSSSDAFNDYSQQMYPSSFRELSEDWEQSEGVTLTDTGGTPELSTFYDNYESNQAYLEGEVIEDEPRGISPESETETLGGGEEYWEMDATAELELNDAEEQVDIDLTHTITEVPEEHESEYDSASSYVTVDIIDLDEDDNIDFNVDTADSLDNYDYLNYANAGIEPYNLNIDSVSVDYSELDDYDIRVRSQLRMYDDAGANDLSGVDEAWDTEFEVNVN